MRTIVTRRRVLFCEQLEPRCMLSSLQGAAEGDFHAVIVAGDPKGTPTDSPTLRIDPNTTSSPFAGVGSLKITAGRSTYICTATPIDPNHVLTAGHCVDLNNNGVPDVSSVTFNLNYGGDLTSEIPGVAWETHPDFTGFNRPSINDDLAVITLGQDLPAGVPIYSLAGSEMVTGATHLYLVGYGRSGTGVKGYTTGASFTVKRDGENIVDGFYTQDDSGRPAANEVFRFDFDGPTSSTNVMGGTTLGNDKETTLGGGDSGGPSFVLVDGQYYLAGVNTFTQGVRAPRFGSLGGGINVVPYLDWITGPHPASGSSGGGATPTGGGGGARDSAILAVMAAENLADLWAAPGELLAVASAESLVHSTWLNSTQSGDHNVVPALSPVSLSAADASGGETDDRAVRSAAPGVEEEDAGLGDDALQSEDPDYLALDAIFEQWSSG